VGFVVGFAALVVFEGALLRSYLTNSLTLIWLDSLIDGSFSSSDR
jgi:hypothetical protein